MCVSDIIVHYVANYKYHKGLGIYTHTMEQFIIYKKNKNKKASKEREERNFSSAVHLNVRNTGVMTEPDRASGYKCRHIGFG